MTAFSDYLRCASLDTDGDEPRMAVSILNPDKLEQAQAWIAVERECGRETHGPAPLGQRTS